MIPDVVSVQDFDTVISNVKAVKAFVDVTNLDRDTIIRRECKVYNKNGEEMPSLEKNLIADIKLEVAKEVQVGTQIRGKLNAEYFETGRSFSPEKVLIAGAPELLDQIDTLNADVLDIENASANINVTRAIKLPANVTLVNTPKEVTINITVDRYQKRDIILDKAQIELLNKQDALFKMSFYRLI